jgi:diguanylate cyclase (GGDEF)-like protein
LEHIGTFGASDYQVSELQLFRDADAAFVSAALAGCEIVHVAAGASVADAYRARLYIVLRGALAVATDAAGDAPATRILAGESVGEQAVLDETPNLAAITATEESELLVVEADLVWQLIDQSNGVARNLLRLLSFRIRAANALLRRRQKLGEFYRQLSMNDGLTGLYNRGWLDDMLPKLAANAQRSGAPLSVLMIDLDHFKKFNDTHGHPAGDDALRVAASVIGAALRPSDFAVRYGGEEMMVLLPETNGPVAAKVAERLCERLAKAVIFGDMRQALPHITGSFGVATLAEGMDEQALVQAADAALYRAKEAGRNRVSH